MALKKESLLVFAQQALSKKWQHRWFVAWGAVNSKTMATKGSPDLSSILGGGEVSVKNRRSK